MQAAVSGPGLNTTLPLTGDAGGNCSLNSAGTMALQASGDWKLQVLLGSAHLNGSSFLLAVQPPRISLSASYALNEDGQPLVACDTIGACPAYFQVCQTNSRQSSPR